MKVVHVVRSDGFAGVERHIAVLAEAQVRAGHEITVIGGPAFAMPRELPAAVEWAPGSSLPQLASALLRRRRPDVLHVHMTAAEAAAVMTASPGTPVVATRHFSARRGSSRAGRAIAPIIRTRVAAQIAISRYVADRVDGQATVVYPGVTPPASHSGRQREKWVLAAQRLEAEKGVDVVIKAFAASGVADRGWSLAVAGDGALRPELEALAHHEGVEHSVHFLGHRQDVPQLMDQAALFLSGCAEEGLGLAVVEAMAAGLPVVATASGGHLETAGLAGRKHLFEPGDAAAAGEILDRLAADRSIREAYGAALQEVQQRHFTPEQQERGTRAVYEQVCR